MPYREAISGALIYVGVCVLIVSLLRAGVNALRKRAKDGCYHPPWGTWSPYPHGKWKEQKNKDCHTVDGAPHLPDCRCSPPAKEEILAPKARGLAPLLLEADRKYFGQVPHPFDFMSVASDSDSDRMPVMNRLQQRQVAAFPAYVKALSDEDLWAMKGLSAPLAKIRKTEMDVRRRRKARTQQKTVKGDCNVEAALFKDPAIVGHVIGTDEPLFVNPQGSLTLEDPKEVVVAKEPIFDTGADANGAPVLDGPRRWRWSYGAENPRTILVTGPHPESDGLVAVIDLRAQTMSSVYVETTQAFPRGTDIDERMDADYKAWKDERA
jgi:hypothetical protein